MNGLSNNPYLYQLEYHNLVVDRHEASLVRERVVHFGSLQICNPPSQYLDRVLVDCPFGLQQAHLRAEVLVLEDLVLGDLVPVRAAVSYVNEVPAQYVVVKQGYRL